jgi:cytidine deaminase
MSNDLDATKYPELVFGIAGPIGIDTDQITKSLTEVLHSVSYDSTLIKLTDEMLLFGDGSNKIDGSDFYREVTSKIVYANGLCENSKDPAALALIGIRAIKNARASITQDKNIPAQRHAFILRQLKRRHEVELLRKIYGRQFVLISAYASISDREKIIEDRLRKSLSTRSKPHQISSNAKELIEKDAEEASVYGQHLRDTFQMADVFINGLKKKDLDQTLTRFIEAFFGKNDIAPSKIEYGMYAAKSASLRSTDLSRQVGAAIFTQDGEIITQGCNEAPKAFGGTYWDLDQPDNRDVKLGHDPNEILKKEILRDLLDRLRDEELLSEKATKQGSTLNLIKHLTAKSKTMTQSDGALAGASILDLTEYGRIVHAEMCAICDAARLGKSIKGAILYCTTFPCHNCTKHILAAGISKVFYMEPYPKSKAGELHANEISIETESPDKVSFLPFLGISPQRYRDIFQKGRRKSDSGSADTWYKNEARPMVDVVAPSYIDLENVALVNLIGEVQQLKEKPV